MEYKEYKKYRQNQAIKKLEEKQKKNILINFIVLLVITIIALSFIRGILNPNSTYSFTQFLQDLVELSNYQINSVNLGDFSIIGDWGIFDGLRLFLNSIMSIINLLVWVCQSLLNVLIVALRTLQIMIFTT